MRYPFDLNEEKNGLWVAQGRVMGGPWQLRFYAQTQQQVIAQAAYEALYAVEAQMSHFMDSSDLMRLNRAPLQTWVMVPEELFFVIESAQQYAKSTQNALDITLGESINDWGFGPKEKPQQMLKEARRGAGYQAYTLDPENSAIMKHQPFGFNLAAIAKGFAVDQAARVVRAMGVDHFLVESAGEICAQGTVLEGAPWVVGLELPVPEKTIIYDYLPLQNKAVATSGSYRKFHVIDGKAIVHTLEPETGRPLESTLLSVTVLHESCMRADALATILYVKGLEAGSAYADQEGIAAQFMFLSGEDEVGELRSQAWMDYLNSCAS